MVRRDKFFKEEFLGRITTIDDNSSYSLIEAKLLKGYSGEDAPIV